MSGGLLCSGSLSYELIPHNCRKSKLPEVLSAGQKDWTGNPLADLSLNMSALIAFKAKICY